ncbi:molybdopterin-dependent oxidoreductase [Candidatus Gracilibacteria bacterium]|nr:molybdopterin-dependent oxidoreductase [Candidatus Gracilibacteria bacterium]
MFSKHSSFTIYQEQPFNGGPPVAALPEQFITPEELFFVRSHGNVPQIDAATYRLEVDGLVERALSLRLVDLAQFTRAAQTATLQCAGNRRDELLALGPIPGELPWSADAIGNARWGGVRLVDVLRAAGVVSGAAHVHFTGLDYVEHDDEGFSFGASIPLQRAIAQDVLLADTMNDLPLPSEHGAPLRVVVPGTIGARSVKWLGRITLAAEPSPNYFQQRAYRLAREAAQEAAMLDTVFLSAAICTPRSGAQLPAGMLAVTGYAIGHGATPIVAVEVSCDNGSNWQCAELLDTPVTGAWMRWQIALDLGPGSYELVARARDADGNTQPADLGATWNGKGYMNNAWHRVALHIRP